MVPAKRKLVSPRLGCVAVCMNLLTPVFGSAEKSVRVESVEKAALLPLSLKSLRFLQHVTNSHHSGRREGKNWVLNFTASGQGVKPLGGRMQLKMLNTWIDTLDASRTLPIVADRSPHLLEYTEPAAMLCSNLLPM